eukprot:scaffold13119_cov141-Skeletonema_dohrnii-CCMP3373.AAC.2
MHSVLLAEVRSQLCSALSSVAWHQILINASQRNLTRPSRNKSRAHCITNQSVTAIIFSFEMLPAAESNKGDQADAVKIEQSKQ